MAVYFKDRYVLVVDEASVLINSHKMELEKVLSSFFRMDWIKSVQSNSKFDAQKVDAVVMSALHVEEESINEWLRKKRNFIDQEFSKKVPMVAIVRSKASFYFTLVEHLFADNRYIDLVHVDHLNSLPVRLLNLLRISVHLNELEQYDKRLKALEAMVENLKTTMKLKT